LARNLARSSLTLVCFLNTERAFIERTRYRWLILQGVFGWVGFEMVRATFIPLVATSAFIGYTQSTQAWLIQPVSVFSIYGLNIVIMLVNYVLAQGIITWCDRKISASSDQALNIRSTRNWLVVTGVILVAWIGTSLVILNAQPKNASTIRVAALRANYPLPAHHDEVNTSQVRFNKFAKQTREAAQQGAQILFTSEMMFNFDPQVEFTEEFRAIAHDTNAHIFITYSVIKEGEQSRNQAVLLNPEGEFSQVYNKTHIPPGEFYDVEGGQFPVFDSTFGKSTNLICHDGNYTDIARNLVQNGAQLIAAPFKEFPGFGEQLWQNLTFRAVENQTAIVVTEATSVASIVDPYGQLVALDVNKNGSEVILIGDVNLGSGEGTPYTSLGDILGWFSLAGMVVFIVFQSVNERQYKKKVQS